MIVQGVDLVEGVKRHLPVRTTGTGHVVAVEKVSSKGLSRSCSVRNAGWVRQRYASSGVRHAKSTLCGIHQKSAWEGSGS